MAPAPGPLTRDDTLYLKGIAILLMLAHHLFAFPERILPPAELVPVTQAVPLEYHLGVLAKICVPVFMFLAGYGFSRRADFSASYVFDKLGRLFGTYWFYFALFIPLGIAFFPEVPDAAGTGQRFSPETGTFLCNLFALCSTYNNEWWFIQPYALLLIALPALGALSKRPWMLLLVSAGGLLAGALFKPSSPWPLLDAAVRQFLIWQFPFVAGFLMRDAVLQWIARRVPQMLRLPLAALVAAALLKLLGLYGAILAAPFILYLCHRLGATLHFTWRPMTALGRMSLPMWLIHTFFCYHFLQPVVFAPRYSVAVFAFFVGLTFAAAVVLERLRGALLATVGPPAAKAVRIDGR